MVPVYRWFCHKANPDKSSRPNSASKSNYRAKYGIEPSIYAAQSYASVYILAEAIANAQSLANLSDFDTVLGEFSFNDVGDTVCDPIMLIVDNGEFQAFE